MSKKSFCQLLGVLVLLGVGCVPVQQVEAPSLKPGATEESVISTEASTVAPMNHYFPTYKRFGEFFRDRFLGYHVADDLEVNESFTDEDRKVYAIADGVVRVVRFASGYGGVMVVTHDVDGKQVNAIYGHIDLSSTTLREDDRVKKGDVLARLGKGLTEETDGEREHLHFALYEGDDIRLSGYVQAEAEVAEWTNPTDFLKEHGGYQPDGPRKLSELVIPGDEFEAIDFVVPADWDVEYIPSLRALNLYQITGNTSARDRSQMLVRYFDASEFQTLSTVTIHEQQDLTIGIENYTARRYDIEKKSSVPVFSDQPAWRNARHLVTDVRDKEGQTRYFVFAVNPDVDPAVYDQLLTTVEFVAN